ncbi:glutamyl-tRNA reductase [Natronolimnobius sp. AArcel1]|uniref:glutamyl-tRNA reductase n=1 Tax=Natronolimnobius sp. AArcel1 TaxID=1679093 RepID=UPI0019D14D37|nr:glutamyl-tRNA reductase [Natronolimnobius sp. AArcel1]
MPSGVIAGARVTYASGSVDELATVSPDSQQTAVAQLRTVPDIDEAYVLSTCNRVEVYVVSPDAALGRAALEEFFGAAVDDAVVYTDHDESLHHLLRVATGLESVVLGEDQIIGQVRTAYEDAREADGIGTMLEAAITKAIHVGERARTETEINEGIVSLGSAATTLAARDLDLEGASALVVGAGEMGQLAGRSLADAGVESVFVANRTVDHAEHLADELAAEETTAEALPLESLSTVTPTADVVVTATGSTDPVLKTADFEDDDTTQIVVDLGQPRDVAPAVDSLSSVTVHDLDDLESITDETREQRADAACEVEQMIDYELDVLADQYKRARADEVIAAMYESAERLKQRELETAFSKLEANGDDLSPGQREIVQSMADALVSQLLAPPTKSLRDAAAEDDWSTINTALQLFDPDFQDDAIQSSLFTEDRSSVGVGTADDD